MPLTNANRVENDESSNRYKRIIAEIFLKHHAAGDVPLEFDRTEIEETASQLGIVLPKNLGDVMYAIRYRIEMPREVAQAADVGMEWVIKGAGRARYRFEQVPLCRIVPNANLVSIKLPDSTPGIIGRYSLNDEQALLAKVRYNRLVDVFLGITAYSLQNHLRTTVKGIGQIEIDEVYVGLDRHGRQFVVPVQAKGGKDKHGVVQTQQDIAWCKQKLPQLISRPVSAQFMADGRIAMFELTLEGDAVRVVDEKHYELVPSKDILDEDLIAYSNRVST